MGRTMTAAAFAAELRGSVGKLDREVANVVKKGAQNVKDEARRNAHGKKKGAPAHINYDMRGKHEAEIGYDKTGAGNLGNLIEFGSVKNGGDNALGNALDAEGGRMPKWMADAVAKVWR